MFMSDKNMKTALFYALQRGQGIKEDLIAEIGTDMYYQLLSLDLICDTSIEKQPGWEMTRTGGELCEFYERHPIDPDRKISLYYVLEKKQGLKENLIEVIGSDLYQQFRTCDFIRDKLINKQCGWKITEGGIKQGNFYRYPGDADISIALFYISEKQKGLAEELSKVIGHSLYRHFLKIDFVRIKLLNNQPNWEITKTGTKWCNIFR